MLRLSLFENSLVFYTESILKRNQVLHCCYSNVRNEDTHGGLVLTHLALPSFLWHVISTDSHIPLLTLSSNSQNVFSAPLCSCSGARTAFRGIKNPEGLDGTSGTQLRCGTTCVPCGRCLGSSMLAPFPYRRCGLLMRHSRSAINHYTASAGERHNHNYAVRRRATLPASAD